MSWSKWSWTDLKWWASHCERLGIRATSVHLNADGSITLVAARTRDWLAFGMEAPTVDVTVQPDEQERYLMGPVLDACAREAAALIEILQAKPSWERRAAAPVLVSAGQSCSEPSSAGQSCPEPSSGSAGRPA